MVIFISELASGFFCLIGVFDSGEFSFSVNYYLSVLEDLKGCGRSQLQPLVAMVSLLVNVYIPCSHWFT